MTADHTTDPAIAPLTLRSKPEPRPRCYSYRTYMPRDSGKTMRRKKRNPLARNRFAVNLRYVN